MSKRLKVFLRFVINSFYPTSPEPVTYFYLGIVSVYTIACPFVLKSASLETRTIEYCSSSSMEDLSINQSTLVVEMTEKGPDFNVLVDNVTQKVIIACRETLSQAKWVPHILAS